MLPVRHYTDRESNIAPSMTSFAGVDKKGRKKKRNPSIRKRNKIQQGRQIKAKGEGKKKGKKSKRRRGIGGASSCPFPSLNGGRMRHGEGSRGLNAFLLWTSLFFSGEERSLFSLVLVQGQQRPGF